MSHPLFQPCTLKTLPLRNRIVMAPMTRCRSAAGDVPTPLMAEHYVQRATAGLIVTEGIPVSPRGRGYLWTPGIYTADQVAGWKQVTDAVHQAGGRLFAQIWHVGRISHASLQPGGAAPLGPTAEHAGDTTCFALDADGNPGIVPTSPPEALDADGIAGIRDEFVRAARNAIEVGMDGVEVHGANGYLLDQFLSPVVNRRDDDYGGSIENRSRLLLEIVDAVAGAIGAERVGLRISPNGRYNAMPEDPQLEALFLYLAAELDARGIAYLHLNDQATNELPGIPDGLLAKLRDAFSDTLIVCGGYDAQRARDAIDQGLADLVAFGAPYVANPDLATRLEHGWPLNTPDPNSFYGGGEKGYTDYPTYEP